jgi:plasmid stabilization system protein ParE
VKLRFAPRASNDLIDIADFIGAESPQGARRVRDSILESLQLLADFPRLGRRQSVEGVRKHVTRRYGYAVYYLVDDTADELVALTIQHPARERLLSDR